MKILDRKTKQSNPDVDVVLVAVKGSGLGKQRRYWYLVEMKHNSVYKKVNGKDVVNRLERYKLDYSRILSLPIYEIREAFNNAVKA